MTIGGWPLVYPSLNYLWLFGLFEAVRDAHLSRQSQCGPHGCSAAICLSTLPLTWTRSLASMFSYGLAGLMLVIPILIAAFVNLDKFDFGGPPGGILYIGSYLFTLIVTAWGLWTYFFVKIIPMSDNRFHILKSTSDLTASDIRALYGEFNSPIARFDCGKKCAPHNPSGKPFCCDICQAVPAAYKSEWKYLEQSTDLWHKWRGDECEDTTPQDVIRLKADTPRNMVLLACLGPSRCQREFRALSCRQFPFFPYVTSDYRFIGLAYEWQFEEKCWVISHLSHITQTYRDEFVRTYDKLFALFQDEFDHYAYHSEIMRSQFIKRRKRFPLLHRNGSCYLVSAASERLRRVDPGSLPRFGYYR